MDDMAEVKERIKSLFEGVGKFYAERDAVFSYSVYEQPADADVYAQYVHFEHSKIIELRGKTQISTEERAIIDVNLKGYIRKRVRAARQGDKIEGYSENPEYCIETRWDSQALLEKLDRLCPEFTERYKNAS